MISDNFDFKEYSEALNKFIINVEALPYDLEHPELKEASINVCRTLRVARLDVYLYEDRGPDKIAGIRCINVLSTGKHDMKRSVNYAKHMSNGSNVEYIVYPFIGEPDWSNTEHEKIIEFLTVMFVFNGRTNLLNIAEKLAYYDQDLNIPNMPFFFREVETLIRNQKIDNYCCCRFNMKNFTLVNRQLGRKNGTEVMYKFIKSLQHSIEDFGNVCRIGGDNFLAYFSKDMFDTVKDHLMGTKIQTDNTEIPEIRISAHAGYFFVNDQCRSCEEIMDKLIVAMSMAKSNINTPYIVYDDNIRKKQLQKKWVESVFYNSIEKEEFLVYYQPKVDLKTYKIDGAEALCRWSHEGELIAPYKFIPYLEMSNNICMLDFYMLEHVCADIRRWLDEGRSVVKVSVNLSRLHLGTEGFVERIIKTIDKYNVPHKYIEIELTETTTDVDYNELKKLVFQLSDAGIYTSIDDFGTGFSSLSLIYDLPWNIIKIDKSFLPSSDNKGNNQKQIILKHIITLAQNLGMECIVEGVETIEHISLLKSNNCFRAQGFYFDKPMPVNEFEKLL